MEHRYSQRIRRDTKLFIYDRGTPIAIGHCKNASRYGLFIETEHWVAPNQPLEIEMIYGWPRRATKRQSRRMKCYVVHVTSEGFGVELDEERINLFGAVASTRAVAEASEAEQLAAQ